MPTLRKLWGAGVVLGLIVGHSAGAAEPRAVKPIWGAPGSSAKPSGRPAGKEEAVDLGSLSSSNVKAGAAKGKSTAQMSPSMHGPSTTDPHFKFYFDFMYKYRPGLTTEGSHGFDSYHQLMLVEIMPSSNLTFATEVSASPRYYEVDYQTSPKMTWRWGKIWIPFDDMAPHNIFGGRINTSELHQGNEAAYLPDLWADLGVGMKYQILDTVPLASELHLYVVNGFRSGGTDPTGSGGAYPLFSTPPTSADNNNDKAFGTRLHMKFFQRLGFGVSLYRGAWSDKGAPKSRGINMFGLDSQLRPSNSFELRAGLSYATVELPETSSKDSYNKGGAYLEAGYKFGENLNWKFLVQTGIVQNDSRVKDNGDKQIVGVRLLRRMGPIEGSIYYSRDVMDIPGKANKNYGHLRLVTAF